MARAKGGFKTRRRHKKILKMAKGYWGRRKNTFRAAVAQVRRSLMFAYIHRRQRRRNFRRLWIIRINAACRAHGMTYSEFMKGLSRAGVALDRKMLADLAVSDGVAFGSLVQTARAALGSGQ